MKKTYKRNFLTKVIVRIDFDDVKIENGKELDALFKKEFPTVQKLEGFEGSLTFEVQNLIEKQNIQNAVKSDHKKTTIYQYLNELKKKKFQYGSKFLFIEYNKYTNSNELLHDVETVIGAFIKTNNINKISRFGLRYINEIELKEKNPLDWNKYLNNDLLGSLTFGENTKTNISRAMTQLFLKKDDADLLFQFGIWNKDFPGEIMQKEFILDYDCYSRLPFSMDDITILDLAKQYNLYIETLFEKSITEYFRKLLNK